MVIILLNRQRNPYLRVASLVIAMAVGYILAWWLDMLPTPPEQQETPIITVPEPFLLWPLI